MSEPTFLQKTLLENRNIQRADWEKFLNPDFAEGIYDPFLLPDMQKAVERILLAIEKNEKIVIYSDYDCDGIPGAVVLHDFFKVIGYSDFSNYIPHRHNEGYGLHAAAIEKFGQDGITLMITVDLGITNIKEVALAQSLGIDVILTDHHLLHSEEIEGVQKQILPPAFAVINAKRDDNKYPDNMLSGCATAWKLVCALVYSGQNKKIKEFENIPIGFTKWLLDLVAISTVADMVPLQNENRVLAHYGLKVLRKSRRPGIHALLLKAGVKIGDITEEDIGFGIAPRLNAASRMDVPMEAFYLLSAPDEKTAQNKATHLEVLNSARKDSVASAMKKAHKMSQDKTDKSVLVAGDLDWSPGILGLIASRLKDEYKKTVFVWGAGEGASEYKGSCRSDSRTHLIDLMSLCSPDTFLHMGGHEMAGGFSLEPTKVFDLENSLNEAYAKMPHASIETEEKSIVDCELKMTDISKSLFDEIQTLAPFGVANPKPVFLFKDVLLADVQLFGKTKNHLKLVCDRVDGSTIEAIKFFASSKIVDSEGAVRELKATDRVDIEAHIERENFGYKRGLRLRIVAIQIRMLGPTLDKYIRI